MNVFDVLEQYDDVHLLSVQIDTFVAARRVFDLVVQHADDLGDLAITVALESLLLAKTRVVDICEGVVDRDEVLTAYIEAVRRLFEGRAEDVDVSRAEDLAKVLVTWPFHVGVPLPIQVPLECPSCGARDETNDIGDIECKLRKCSCGDYMGVSSDYDDK